MTMRIKEAREIAANPAAHLDKLTLAHLKLGNAALRAIAHSPAQKELQALLRNIEAMPRALWVYPPEK